MDETIDKKWWREDNHIARARRKISLQRATANAFCLFAFLSPSVPLSLLTHCHSGLSI